MATTNTIGLDVTYLDLANRLGPDNKVATIIELLAKRNAILEDAVVIEGNLPTGHKTTVRTGLPSATWRKLNYGVPQSKSETQQIVDVCGMLEAYAEVDKALADLNGNTAAFRLSEDRAFLESMNQQMAEALFYESEKVNPERITGFTPRYSASSTDPTQSGYNVIKCYSSASGSDQTSLWFVTWGELQSHLIYPKGSQAGIVHEDKGQVTLLDANGNKYEGYRSHYKWDIGLVVRDWRYNVRVCNIDVSAMTTTSEDLYGAMIDAYYRIPDVNSGKTVIYANRWTISWLHKIALEKGKYNLNYDNVAGKPILKFLDIPIKRVDAIKLTEDVVA